MRPIAISPRSIGRNQGGNENSVHHCARHFRERTLRVGFGQAGASRSKNVLKTMTAFDGQAIVFKTSA
jgi:hypothetical protein